MSKDIIVIEIGWDELPDSIIEAHSSWNETNQKVLKFFQNERIIYGFIRDDEDLACYYIKGKEVIFIDEDESDQLLPLIVSFKERI